MNYRYLLEYLEAPLGATDPGAAGGQWLKYKRSNRGFRALAYGAWYNTRRDGVGRRISYTDGTVLLTVKLGHDKKIFPQWTDAGAQLRAQVKSIREVLVDRQVRQ